MVDRSSQAVSWNSVMTFVLILRLTFWFMFTFSNSCFGTVSINVSLSFSLIQYLAFTFLKDLVWKTVTCLLLMRPTVITCVIVYFLESEDLSFTWSYQYGKWSFKNVFSWFFVNLISPDTSFSEHISFKCLPGLSKLG